MRTSSRESTTSKGSVVCTHTKQSAGSELFVHRENMQQGVSSFFFVLVQTLNIQQGVRVIYRETLSRESLFFLLFFFCTQGEHSAVFDTWRKKIIIESAVFTQGNL